MSTSKKTTSSSSSKKAATSSAVKRSTTSSSKKKTGSSSVAVFDDILSFALPVGYVFSRETGDDGEEKVFIRAGAYTDDNGNAANEFNASISYIEIVDDDTDKIPAGEKPLDTICRRNAQPNKFSLLSADLRTGLMMRESPLNLLGHIMKFYVMMVIVEKDDHKVISISDITTWNDDDQKNLKQYEYMIELINSMRIGGKALPPLGITADELMKKLTPDFDGTESIKGSVGLQISNGNEVVSETTLVGDDDGTIHRINKSHGPNKLDGKYEDYEISDGGFGKCKKNKRVVHIPDGVTAIESNAFDGCKSLTEVTIPSSVCEIGMSAFNECIKLKKIVIPEGVEEIPWNCFSGCLDLTEVTIPSSVREIGASAFKDCRKLKKIVIPEGVEEIPWNCFYGCSEISEIIIPSSVKSISMYAFSGCKKLQSITLPECLTNMEMNAFNECESLSEITIPSLITVIEDDLFCGCKNLVKVTFKGDVTSIKDSAFYGCTKLKTIVIPKGLTELGERAFQECESLEKIDIPQDITFIEDSAFSGCKKLTSILLPKGITSIGDFAFLHCESLTEITLPEGLEKIGENAFDGCKKLKSIHIPDSVTEIGEFAFSECNTITEITIPDSVRKIQRGLFSECAKLKKVIFPKDVEEFGEGVFYSCDALTDLILPDGVTEIGDYMFSGLEKLKTVKLPSTIESIGERAFSDCTALQEVILPENITSIPEGVFKGCEKLKKLEIPNSVDEIGEYAFYDCTSLGTIKIPDGVSVIHEAAFANCENLKSVTLPDSIEEIEESAFRNCKALIEIEFPEGLKSIGDYAFDTCESLISLEFPDSVTSIGQWAFDDCESLRSVSLPKNVELGAWAFPEDDNVKIVYRTGNGRVSRRKPTTTPTEKETIKKEPKQTGKYSEAEPDNELYSHYGKLKREADKFKRMGVRFEQNNGEEYQALRLKKLLEETGKNKTGIYRKLSNFIASDKYTLNDIALKIAQIFRVDKSVFVARHDDEGDVHESLMDKKYKFSALRSFAWTLADLADREGKSIDDYEYSDLSAICTFIEEREWLNYEGGSWFDGLCSHDDIHVYYMPDALIKSGEADQICDVLSLGPIASLEAFRNDLEQLKNVIIRLHNGLLKTRDRSKKLEGAEAAVILAWCVMAVSADEPFFSEDGPMFFYHSYPDGTVNASPISVGSGKSSVKKAAPKAKKTEASAVMNNAANYEIIKGTDGRERIKLGEYPVGSPIVWLVLEKNGNELLLISEYGLDAKAYSWGFQDKPSEWATCSLRKWLNEDFFEEAFDETERSMIQDDIHDTYKKTGDGEVDTGFVTDKVFLLSARELMKYFPSQRDKICRATAFAKSQGAEISFGPDQCCWWLRSPAVEAMGLSGWAGSVQSDGNTKGWGYGTGEYCARPVIRVKSEQFQRSSSAISKIESLEDTLSSMTFDQPAEDAEQQKAIDEAKTIINKMSGDLQTTKSALEKHAEELKRQEEEREKRKAEAKARGKSSKDESDMLAVLLIEKDQGNLDRDDDNFAEVFAEDFGAYSADQLIKLRKKVKAKMNDEAFIEAAKEDMLSRKVEDRFSISTANWFNLSNHWDFNEKGLLAIEKTRQYYQDSELKEVNDLMGKHKQAGIDSVNRQLTGFNSSWDSFGGVRNDLYVCIGPCEEPIPDSRKVFDVMIDETNHAYIQLQHPSMGFLTIPIMNLFASVWKTTPEKIWDAALNNEINDSRGVYGRSRSDAILAKTKALASIKPQKAQPRQTTTTPARNTQASQTIAKPVAGASSHNDTKIRELQGRIASLKRELDSIKGIFGFVKRNKIKKEINDLENELNMLKK